MKIRPVGMELFHADRRTDMTKLIVAFRNFAKVPTNTNQIGYKKNSKKLAECFLNSSQPQELAILLSVLCVGKQITPTIILQCAVNKKKTLLRSSASQKGENVHFTSETRLFYVTCKFPSAAAIA